MTSARRAATALVAICLAPLLLLVPGAGGRGASAITAVAATPTPTAVAHSTPSTVRGAWPRALVDLPVAGGSGQLRGQVSSLLQRREAAVEAQDRAAWVATVAHSAHHPSRGGFRDRQAAVFDRLLRLPLSLFRYDSATIVRAGRAAVVEVRGTYALGRFGGPRTFRERFALDQRAGKAGENEQTPRRPLLAESVGSRSARVTVPWDLPGMRAVRGRSSLVVGNVAISRMRGYARLADEAVQTVDRHWGTDWSRAPVLVVPATAEQYAELTGQTPSAAASSQVAAVTTGPIEADGRARADQVVVRPATWPELTSQGRAVVVTHEVTHVATRASTTAAVPLWLSEGLADHLAYRSVAMPPTRIAADLLGRVRSGAGPTGLPPDSAFGPEVPDLAASYQAAWLLCRHIAMTHGEAALRRLYRAVATGTPMRRAVNDVLGVDEDQLTAAWLADLRRSSHEVAGDSRQM